MHDHYTSPEPARRVQRALRALWAQAPFYASLSLRLVVQPDSSITNIATDGLTLRYNSEWAGQAPHDDIVESVAGAVVGCMLKHHTRRGDRDEKRWQMAHELVVQPLLRADGLTDRPGGIDDQTIERVYASLEQDQDDDDESAPAPAPCFGQVQDYPSDGDGDNSGDGDADGSDDRSAESRRIEHERQWDEAAAAAAQMQRAQGNEPGHAHERLVGGWSVPADWRTLLRRWMTDHARADHSWSRPNRRFISSGLYLPELHSESMGGLVLAIDTSGSIDTDLLQRFWDEIRSICDEVSPRSVTIIQTDAAVQAVDTYDPSDLPDEIEIVGRSGTRFAPTFDAVRELRDPPAGMIYFTDLECDDYGDAPDCPLLWAQQPSRSFIPPDEPPFGDVVELDHVA